MGNTGRTNNKYTPEFKIKVAEDYLSGKNGGMTSLLRKYNLKSDWQIRQWRKIYATKGKKGFYVELRGKGSSGRPKSNKVDYDNLSDKEKIEYLEMENSILKKLKAIQNQKLK